MKRLVSSLFLLGFFALGSNVFASSQDPFRAQTNSMNSTSSAQTEFRRKLAEIDKKVEKISHAIMQAAKDNDFTKAMALQEQMNLLSQEKDRIAREFEEIMAANSAAVTAACDAYKAQFSSK